MKKFAFLSTIITAVAVMLFNVSCSDIGPEADFNIVGKWKMTISRDHIRNFNIREDGTCSIADIKNETAGDAEEYKWEYNEEDSILTITNEDGDTIYKYSIFDISKSANSCKWIDRTDGEKTSYEVNLVK